MTDSALVVRRSKIATPKRKTVELAGADKALRFGSLQMAAERASKTAKPKRGFWPAPCSSGDICVGLHEIADEVNVDQLQETFGSIEAVSFPLVLRLRDRRSEPAPSPCGFLPSGRAGGSERRRAKSRRWDPTPLPARRELPGPDRRG